MNIFKENLKSVFYALKEACYDMSQKEGTKKKSIHSLYISKPKLANFHYFSFKGLMREISKVQDYHRLYPLGDGAYCLFVVLDEVYLNVYFAYNPESLSKGICDFILVRIEKVGFSNEMMHLSTGVYKAAANGTENFSFSNHYIRDRYEERGIELEDVVNGIANHPINCYVRDGKLKLALNNPEFVNRYGSAGVAIVARRTNEDVAEGKARYCIVTAYLKDELGKGKSFSEICDAEDAEMGASIDL